MPTFKVKNQNNEWENVVSFFGSAGEGGVAVETDPTVPAWAKAANKPTYTANEVGAKASGTVESIATGGTGATTAAGALVNLGITATAAELNKLDGVTATTTELNYVDGVTSAIQTQLNAKMPKSGGAFTNTIPTNGISLTSGTDYGTSLPSSAPAGKIFFKKV